MIARDLAVGAPVAGGELHRVLRGLDAQADIPPIADGRESLPRAIAALAMFSVVVAALTAGPVIGATFAPRDLVLLLALHLGTAAVIWRVRWLSVSEPWLLAIIGLQVVLVACLITLTGGPASPYLAFYAPVIAIAGWYLRPTPLALAFALIASTELWRALVVDPGASLEPMLVSLPVYGLVGWLAWLASRWSITAAIGSRRDQVRAAATLHAVRAMAARGGDEPAEVLAAIAGRAMAAAAWLIPDAPHASGDGHACGSQGRDHAALPVVARGRSVGAIGFCRTQPFSTSELRLAAILTHAIGQTLEIQALAKRCGAEEGAEAGAS